MSLMIRSMDYLIILGITRLISSTFLHPLVIFSPTVLCLGSEVGHENLMLLDVIP